MIKRIDITVNICASTNVILFTYNDKKANFINSAVIFDFIQWRGNIEDGDKFMAKANILKNHIEILKLLAFKPKRHPEQLSLNF